MSALDGSVVNSVLPIIRADFSSSIARLEWVVTIYLLVISGLLLSFGRLGDIQGHKRVYLAGFAIFLVCSMLCAASPTIEFLIGFRAFQAIGAAMLSANSPAILTKSFPESRRGQALGLLASMTYLGLTVGPSLGGFLAQQFGWRTVFYINLPIGLFAFWMSYKFIAADHPMGVREKFDIKGASLFITGLVMLLIGLNQGHNWGWISFATIGIITISAVLLYFFIRQEQREPSPMLDLRLFANATFSNATISAILNYICVYSILFLMPFYLLEGRQFTPFEAGIILTAMPISMAIVAPLSGIFSDRFGTRFFEATGMFLLAFGLVVLSRLTMETTAAAIALRLVICGLGIGIFISPNTSALMGAAPKNRKGIASGILATSRNTGMALGIGLSGAIFNTLLLKAVPGNSNSLYNAIQISFLAAASIALLGGILKLINFSNRVS